MIFKKYNAGDLHMWADLNEETGMITLFVSYLEFFPLVTRRTKKEYKYKPEEFLKFIEDFEKFKWSWF